MSEVIEVKIGGFTAYLYLFLRLLCCLVSLWVLVTQVLNLGSIIVFATMFFYSLISFCRLLIKLVVNPNIMKLTEKGIEIFKNKKQSFDWNQIESVSGYLASTKEKNVEGLAIQLKDNLILNKSQRAKINKKIPFCELTPNVKDPFYSDILIDLDLCNLSVEKIINFIIPRLNQTLVKRSGLSHQELFIIGKSKVAKYAAMQFIYAIIIVFTMSFLIKYK